MTGGLTLSSEKAIAFYALTISFANGLNCFNTGWNTI